MNLDIFHRGGMNPLRMWVYIGEINLGYWPDAKANGQSVVFKLLRCRILLCSGRSSRNGGFLHHIIFLDGELVVKGLAGGKYASEGVLGP